MKVFVTGATGLIGFAVVRDLIAAGHEVTGLARSEASGKRLTEAGARVVVGTLENLGLLRKSASAAEGAIHTAFYHQLSHAPLATRLGIFLGGAPSQIGLRFMRAAAAADRRAIEAIASALPKNGGSLVATFGTLGMKHDILATEDASYDHDRKAFGLGRASTEDVLKAWAARGLRTSAIRLPPIVHGPHAFGLASLFIPIARRKKVSPYVGDGMNRWPSVNHLDAARLFRLALEKGPAGGTYHGVDEEGIAFREIAEVIGQRLKVPSVSMSEDEARKHFGMFAQVVPLDNPTSSRLTRERLGWAPTHIGLLEEMRQSDVFSKV